MAIVAQVDLAIESQDLTWRSAETGGAPSLWGLEATPSWVPTPLGRHMGVESSVLQSPERALAWRVTTTIFTTQCTYSVGLEVV